MASKDINENKESGTYWNKCSNYGLLHPWKLRLIKDEGYAAFSLKKFEPGDLILTEFPTVSVLGWHPYNDEQLEQIENRVKLLVEDESKAFYNLANVYPEYESTAAGIFMTNSFDMTDSPNGLESGLTI